MTLEINFNIPFATALAKKEKQIQQSYRPIIGIHKWFARRPGTVFRNLLLAEFNGEYATDSGYWKAHNFEGIIADPFMGGGIPIFEANRLGFSVIGTDINPMAYWIVRQSLTHLDLEAFTDIANQIILDVESEVREYYRTRCNICDGDAEVKYFIHVKTQPCPECGRKNDLFPGYLLASAVRHPKHVVVCSHCEELNEYDEKPKIDKPGECQNCGNLTYIEGPAKRNRIHCFSCGHQFRYPPKQPEGPPKHRIWAIEYHCKTCKPTHKGRFFKKPDFDDLNKLQVATDAYAASMSNLPIPEDEIPVGDETNRLHRWGYRYFWQMFNPRQLFGLGTLLGRINQVHDVDTRHALLTVFSDFLRYQNMLSRYDTYALKCQDIFSVHGFPVGLIQCENNLLGITNVGSGSYRHFIKKYIKAKQYCEQPFETQNNGKKKKIVPIDGEQIRADFVDELPGPVREAWISSNSAETIPLQPDTLDGVFTDPPYFDNVQYAELMDFCYSWLRIALGEEFESFLPETTRQHAELTGNQTLGRGLDHFTDGLSRIFCHYASALKQNAPFVFTYHHNNPQAYIPLIVAILDSGLYCNATLPVPGEMSASLHIAKTKSSVLDTVFVCRNEESSYQSKDIITKLSYDISELKAAGLTPSDGDIKCLALGHMARMTINKLKPKWNSKEELKHRMAIAIDSLEQIMETVYYDKLIIRTKTNN